MFELDISVPLLEKGKKVKQQLGLGVENGKISLMKIERDGRKVTQTVVAGPVPAGDIAAIKGMINDYAG